MKRAGIIGLGAMGSHMAKNIIKAGHRLVVFDVRPEAMDGLARLGAEKAACPKEVGANADIVFLMVQNFQQCEACLLGPTGLLAGMAGGALVVTSTIAPDEVKKVASYCGDKGVAVLDSPVSGGTKGAADGSLTLMISGKDEVYRECLPVLECLGSNLVKVGDEVGQGQAIKAVNQLLVGVHMVAMAEAMVLGTKCGLDPEVVYRVVSSSAGNSRVFENRVPTVINRDFSLRSTLAIQFKDTDIAVRTADSVKAPVFLAPVARELYKIAATKSATVEDSSAIVKLYEELADVTVVKGGTPQSR
jgi:3-hydroxyisobutyrate dehydrogenase-like beta-hydroxyacid dehydrogenase